MNLSILDLQARLADQVSPLTTKQREVIHAHPIRSAEMLSAVGIADTDWLEAVRTHHEVPGGAGYPCGMTDVGELAEPAALCRCVHRPAEPAREPGGDESAPGRAPAPPDVGLQPADLGAHQGLWVYPPGSMVRLASGELGVVVRSGEKAHLPLVATLTNAAGESTPTSLLRDSARDEHAVVALLSPQSVPVWLSDERLAELIGSV